MADNKYYLDQEGLEQLIAYIKNELNNKMNKDDEIILPDDLLRINDIQPLSKTDIDDIIASLNN